MTEPTGRLAVETTGEPARLSMDHAAMGAAWSGREARAAVKAKRRSEDFMAACWVRVNRSSFWESTMRAGMEANGGFGRGSLTLRVVGRRSEWEGISVMEQ
jgi:hypothetical protein